MSLIYRGQTYTTANTVIHSIAATTGTYRGQSYQIRYATNLNLKSKQNLVYRGVAYGQGSGHTQPVSGVAPVYG